MLIPSDYKETGSWVVAKPSLAEATMNEPWWALFHDQILNDLENKVTCDNYNLKIAFNRYQEALAIAQATRSAMYPTVKLVGTAARQKNSGNFLNNSPHLLYDTFLLAPVLNYELDAWGRVRNAVVANDSLARATEFDLAAINLSLHTELAREYFQLRGNNAAQRILDKTVIAYKKALYLTQQRHMGGVSPQIEVDQAQTLLENARTLATDMRLQRAQIEHAIAVLVGEMPASFKLPSSQHRRFHFVTIAPELPSTLLERRPDIAAAEQRAHAANANIGVARAAFFPQFNLISLAGFQSQKLSDLFNTKSLIWSLGPSTALTLVQPEMQQVLFDGFKLSALLSKAKADYFETIAAYQQTVLTAFKEVEDALVALHRLEQEYQTQTLSTQAARRALYQANRRYKGGIATFLDVVITENEALQSELALVKINTRRQLASVGLINALGGGWQLQKKVHKISSPH